MFLTILSILISIIIIFVTTVQYFIVRNTNRLKDFKGPRIRPFFGHVYDMSPSPVENFKKLSELHTEYDGNFKVFAGPFANVWTSDPKMIEYLLTSNKHLSKNFIYKFLEPWLGTGLLTSTGSKWKQRRKIITPAFHFKILEKFTDGINASCKIFIDKLSAECNKGDFDVYPYVTLNALDIICETAMGTSINAQNDSKSDYVSAVKNMGDIFLKRISSSWKRIDFLFQFTSDKKLQDKSLKVLHNMTEVVIKSRRAEWEERIKNKGNEIVDLNYGQRKKLAFLDMLLDSTMDGKPLSDADIREEVDTFMFEGHDTVSSAVSFTIYSLANNPDIQEKLFAEMSSIFGNDKTRSVTYDDLQNMPYMDLVIKESLRMYPPVPIIARFIEEDIEIENRKIPKNTSITIGVYMLHHNPKYFPEPEKFNPDRFIDDVGKTTPYMYTPFSAGPRNCIGQKFALMEMKITLSSLIRNYELLPAGSDKSVMLAPTITLNSQNGVNVRIKSRPN